MGYRAMSMRRFWFPPLTSYMSHIFKNSVFENFLLGFISAVPPTPQPALWVRRKNNVGFFRIALCFVRMIGSCLKQTVRHESFFRRAVTADSTTYHNFDCDFRHHRGCKAIFVQFHRYRDCCYYTNSQRQRNHNRGAAHILTTTRTAFLQSWHSRTGEGFGP